MNGIEFYAVNRNYPEEIFDENVSRKIDADIYIDDKIPSSERPAIPLVCDALGNIVWIPGVRRSMHAAVGRHTASVLLLSLEDMEQGEES